jgi:hypothetical protein
MTQFPQFMGLDQRSDILRQAIEIAHLETCEETGQPGFIYTFLLFLHFWVNIVLPSNGFFLILKGGVISPPVTSQLPLLSTHVLMGTVCIPIRKSEFDNFMFSVLLDNVLVR